MHEEAGFLSAIRQTPADDTARLVYADWLDEQDDPNCKTKADFIRLELRTVEVPEQGRNRFRIFQQLQNLAARIDPSWLAVISHPKLESCPMSCKLECPKQWDRLAPTNNAKVRFCGTCKKNVHYCETLQEAQNQAANGNGVAITLALVRRSFDSSPPRPGPPKYLARSRRLRRARPAFLLRPPGYPHVTPAPIPLPIEPIPAPPVPAEPDPPELNRNPRPRRQNGRRRNRRIERENWEEVE